MCSIAVWWAAATRRARHPAGRGAVFAGGYCTLAFTLAGPVKVKVQVWVSLAVAQAPDQIAVRPLLALSVIEVPVAKLADPELPTGTLIPAGLEAMVTPERPVAVTVSVELEVAGAGFTVRLTDCEAP